MIPNLKPITSPNATNLWRSGQPESIEDWKQIISLGIKVVVRLDIGADPPAGLGLIAYDWPINFFEQLILEPQQRAVVLAVQDLASGNSLVHCKNGWDRTGLIVGVYRVRIDGWSKDDAYQEMIDNGFHPELFGLQMFWELHV